MGNLFPEPELLKKGVVTVTLYFSQVITKGNISLVSRRQ